MPTTALAGPGRVAQLVWGARSQNVLTFGYPAGVDRPRFWRDPRDGSGAVATQAGGQDGWRTGYEHRGVLALRHVSVSAWADLQAFLDWATSGNSFSLVPDAVNMPLYAVPGCFLEAPFVGAGVAAEAADGAQTVDLALRNPTYDLGLAWRGLWLEYRPGASIADPYAFAFTRAQAAFRVDSAGVLRSAVANVLRDNHYIAGVRTTLLEPLSVNSCLQSQTLATAPWGGNQVTVTNAFAAAPDLTTTACKLLPTAVNSTHYWTQNIAITAGEFESVSVYLKAGGYARVRLRLVDAGTTTGCGMLVNLTTGVVTSTETLGAAGGVFVQAVLVPLANGWYRLELDGKISTADVTGNLFLYIQDNAGNDTYTGDGASYVLAWGAQFERWGANIQGHATSYIPTTAGSASRAVDLLDLTGWPWQAAPQWWYLKYVDLGWSRRAVFENLVSLSDSAANTPLLRTFTGSGTAGLNPGSRFNYTAGGAGFIPSQSAAQILTSPPSPYDTVELFCRLVSDGAGMWHCEVQRSVNGGAVVAASDVAVEALDFSTVASVLHLYVGNGGDVGLLDFKMSPDTSVTTLAKAALA